MNKRWLYSLGAGLAFASVLATTYPGHSTPGPDQTLPPFEAVVPVPLGQSEPERVVFKWQDSSGAWHYSDSVPAGVKSQALLLSEERTRPLGVGRASAPSS